MTRLLVATRNPGKQREFRGLLAPWFPDLCFPDDIGLPEAPEEADLESFSTFEANARAKARWFAARSGLPALADDSGLEVFSLGGAPGVHSKRFAGLEGPDPEVTDANNRELLRRLNGATGDARRARYRCVLVLSRSIPAEEVVAEGECAGSILTVARGPGGFGYDPLFWCDELGRSFGEATLGEKARVSHRGRAVEALVRRMGSLSRLS